MKKILITILSVVFLLCFVCFTGCDLKGKDGTNGQDGANGKSAYEIAVENGFNGTEDEWLNSLKGANGENGQDGTNGTNGKDGANGKSAYELYKEKYGYEGTEDEWLTDLLNGKLGEDENPLGLDFYLLPDNTYGVKAGNAIYYDNVVIPSTYKGKAVTKILKWAFYTEGFDLNLKTVVISDSIVEIGEYAFDGCRSLESVVIPDSVKVIGGGAFNSCSSLKSVTIGNGNVTIEEGAFFDCSSLESFTMGNGESVIGKFVFGYCVSLKNVTLGSGVKSIEEGAFEYCTKMESIVIPDSVTEIAKSAFYACVKLSNVTIGNGVKIIGEGAFFECPFTSIVIPDGVESIGDRVFVNCNSLLDVVIPNSVTEMGKKVFYGCTSLTEITYKGTVEQWEGLEKEGWNYGSYIVTIHCTDGDALSESEGLTYTLINDDTEYEVSGMGSCTSANLVIPSAYNEKPVTRIGNNAFKNNSTIEVVTINNAKEIGEEAFLGCSSLKSVTMGKAVKTIGKLAFAAGELGYSGNGSITSVKIGENVESIGDHAFFKCDLLESIEIPNGVEEIKSFAFSECSSLKSIVIPDSVKTLGRYLFDECSSLENVTVGNGLEVLENHVFAGCVNLKYNESGDGLYLGNSENLYLILADTKDNNLTSITVNEKCKFIGSGAFYGCGSLESVTIPQSVISINLFAFYNCNSLETISYSGNKEAWEKVVKDEEWNSYSKILKVICSDGEAYVPSLGLCFSLINDDTEYEVSDIGDCDDCIVIIPSEYNGKPVTSLHYQAFRFGFLIESVVIPESVTKMGEYVFDLCSNLTEITYLGSKEVFGDIGISPNWNKGSSIKVVHCADGDIDLTVE